VDLGFGVGGKRQIIIQTRDSGQLWRHSVPVTGRGDLPLPGAQRGKPGANSADRLLPNRKMQDRMQMPRYFAGLREPPAVPLPPWGSAES